MLQWHQRKKDDAELPQAEAPLVESQLDRIERKLDLLLKKSEP